MESGGIFKIRTGESGSAPTAPLLLVLSATLIAGLLTPTPTLGGIGKKVSDVCARSTDAAFRAKYCSAAKDLKHGYNANLATSAVWTGVSVACGAACGKALGGTYCKLAGYAGAAGEGVLTRKFTDALVGEAAKWGGQAAAAKSTEAKPAESAVATGVGKVNADACQASGTSALKAYEKYSNSKQNEKSLTELRDQTKDMNTPTSQNLAGTAGASPASDEAAGANGSAATAGGEICGDAAIATALGAVRCAARSDPSLPPYAKSEEFLKDLQKATGKSPDAFFADFESPAKSIFDSPVAGALPETQQRGLADSLSAMEGYADAKAAKLAANSPAPGGYSPAGGAVPESDTGFDVNGMIAGALGQLGGGAEEAANDAANGVARAAFDRRPAAANANAAENRAISIFDRVQWRYGSVSIRDRLGVP